MVVLLIKFSGTNCLNNGNCTFNRRQTGEEIVKGRGHTVFDAIS